MLIWLRLVVDSLSPLIFGEIILKFRTEILPKLTNITVKVKMISQKELYIKNYRNSHFQRHIFLRNIAQMIPVTSH